MNGDERSAHGEDERPARVRSFFALPVSGEALGVLARARDAMEKGAERSRVAARFLPDEALHITLCFLGWVDRAALPEFVRVLEENARVPPFSARLTGLGAFSTAKRARVVVAELADGDGRLASLARSVSLAAEKLGVPFETRAYRPHVTLARMKRPSDVRAWLARVPLEPVAIAFSEIRLYRSLHHAEGGRYEVLARAEFRDRSA